VRFESVDDIWNEIEKIANVNSRTSRSIGQDLFHLIPLFSDPDYIIENWHLEVINEFNLCKNFNISLGILECISSFKLQCFSLIQNEFNAIAQYERVENGK